METVSGGLVELVEDRAGPPVTSWLVGGLPQRVVWDVDRVCRAVGFRCDGVFHEFDDRTPVGLEPGDVFALTVRA